MGASDGQAAGSEMHEDRETPETRRQGDVDEALQIAQRGYAALKLAKIERPESVRWDMCCPAPPGSAALRALPKTQGRPLSVFSRRPPSSHFPSRPTATFSRMIGDPVADWGFAKSNPLDLVPLPGKPASAAADVESSSSQFAHRSRERMARQHARLQARARMERAAFCLVRQHRFPVR